MYLLQWATVVWRLSWSRRQKEEAIWGRTTRQRLQVWCAWFQLHLTLKLVPWWNNYWRLQEAAKIHTYVSGTLLKCERAAADFSLGLWVTMTIFFCLPCVEKLINPTHKSLSLKKSNYSALVLYTLLLKFLCITHVYYWIFYRDSQPN